MGIIWNRDLTLSSGKTRRVVPSMGQPVEKLFGSFLGDASLATTRPDRSRADGLEEADLQLEVVLWEGHEAATGGITPSPSTRGQEALQVLPGRDQQSLDVRVQQATQAEPA